MVILFQCSFVLARDREVMCVLVYKASNMTSALLSLRSVEPMSRWTRDLDRLKKLVSSIAPLKLKGFLLMSREANSRLLLCSMSFWMVTAEIPYWDRLSFLDSSWLKKRLMNHYSYSGLFGMLRSWHLASYRSLRILPCSVLSPGKSSWTVSVKPPLMLGRWEDLRLVYVSLGRAVEEDRIEDLKVPAACFFSCHLGHLTVSAVEILVYSSTAFTDETCFYFPII
jgi:hypothetical protein